MQQFQRLFFGAEVDAHRDVFGDECYRNRLSGGIRSQPPFAKKKERANNNTNADDKRTMSRWFPMTVQERGEGAGKQEQHEADPPNTGNGRNLDKWQALHLRIGEISERTVR